jgi:hypothetical protein
MNMHFQPISPILWDLRYTFQMVDFHETLYLEDGCRIPLLDTYNHLLNYIVS